MANYRMTSDRMTDGQMTNDQTANYRMTNDRMPDDHTHENRQDHPGGDMRTWMRRRWDAMRGTAAEAGMSTAEYAVGTLAACAFAAVLYKIVTSGPVSAALNGLIGRALHAAF